MWSYKRSNGGNRVTYFLGFFILLHLSLVSAQSTWETLSGKAPSIVAKGGFSGLFPDSSQYAYSFALSISGKSTILLCDVRLTKDLLGICLPSLKMDNCTDIPQIFPKAASTYDVNGVSVTGYFPVDFDSTQLSQVSVVQSIYSRSDRFDASLFPILAVEDISSKFKSPFLWLNIEHDAFYAQHNLSMTTYIKGIIKNVIVDYISSPEISFLTSISTIVSNKTKLIFKYLDSDLLEPSTNQTYSSLLSNLTFIKTFANGILVPKTYIWPVSPDNYLLPYTSVVLDAHKEGLAVYASGFANDNFFSYNYSSDPIAEYLSFIDNGKFSVDGFVTDFPVTPSEAIGCFMNLNTSDKSHVKPLIISHNGASGDYPDCTDLAYQYAADNGADIIDCPVQVTKDGTLICMSSINLLDDTTVAKSSYLTRTSTVPALQSGAGIFTFNLTWTEINTLKPKMSAPLSAFKVVRNPRYNNAGKFMNLADFLTFAKTKDLAGVLITVENAPFITEKLNVDIVGSILKTLNSSGYGTPTSPPVTIQSTNSSVLISFKEKSPTKLKLLYTLDEEVSDADSASLADMKRFADAIAVEKQSVYPLNHHFTTGQTKLVKDLQAQGFSVYVYVLMNEFLSQAWDYFDDPTVEINAFVKGAGVDGIITDFPLTARRYKVNACQNLGNNTPSYMLAVQPGGLLQAISKPAQPPALAPLPVLTDSDVAEAPLATTNQNAPPRSVASPRLSSGALISVLLVALYVLFALV